MSAFVNQTQLELAVVGVSGIMALVAILCSLYLALRHQVHWHEPVEQTCIVRILMMVPIYALGSWLAILFGDYALYFNLARDSYEAFVLYQFFCLLTHYFEREAAVHLDVAETDTAHYLLEFDESPWPFPMCVLPTIEPGPEFYDLVRHCILQYVFLKPLMALMAIILYIKGHYHTGSFSLADGYLWITIITTISIALCLYFLLLFYGFIAEVIERQRPMLKFLSIKVLIFFVFWQSLTVSVLYYFAVLPAFFDWSVERSSNTLENLLVCLEMCVLSVAHHWIYPYPRGEPTKLLDTQRLEELVRRTIIRDFSAVRVTTPSNRGREK